MIRRTRTLRIVLFTIVLDTLGVGILMPVIPQLFGNPASAHYLLPHAASPGVGYLLLGLLVAIYPTARFFAAPILGQLSDRHGRKPVLALALAGTTLSYVLFATGILVRNLPLLFVARALDGATGANVSVAQAAVADVTPPSERTKHFGVIGAAFGLGFILGPFLGGVLADPAVSPWFGVATPFWFVAAVAACNTASVLLFFEETHAERRSAALCLRRSLQNIGRASTLVGLRSLLLTSFLFNAGHSFKTSFFSVFLIHRFGFAEREIGFWFAYAGLWTIVSQLVMTRWLAARYSEPQVLRGALLGAAAAMAAYLLAWEPIWVFVIAPLAAICNCATLANIPGLLSRSASADVQGEILGIGASVQALAQSIPPLAAGLLAALLAPEAAVSAAALLVLAAWAVLMSQSRPSAAPAHGAAVDVH